MNTKTTTKVFIPRDLGWWPYEGEEYESYQHSRQPHPPLLRQCHHLRQWKAGVPNIGHEYYIDYYSDWCSVYDECVKWSHLHRSSDEVWSKLEEEYGEHGRGWLVFDDMLEHMEPDEFENLIHFPVAVCDVCNKIEDVCQLCKTLHYKKLPFRSP